MKEISYEVRDLAYKLWLVRNESFRGTRYEHLMDQIPTLDEAQLYAELAAWVLENYTAKSVAPDKPLVIQDGQGDMWVLGDDGNYWFREERRPDPEDIGAFYNGYKVIR